jgi:hypothetical protein
MPLILGTNSIKDTGYNVANSLRVDRNSSAYLTRTEDTDQSDGKKITISIWFKLGAQLGTTRYFFGGHADGSYTNEIGITSNDQLNFSCIANGTNQVTTNRVFRDPSAWYHVVAVLDSTQGTDTNRIKLYINGVEETDFASSSYPSEDAVTEYLKNGGVTRVGDKGSGGNNWDGYLAEVCVLDGQALDQNSFGEFDEDSPTIWKPIDPSGLTFGNNGFYLDFEDSSNLGNDKNGGSDFSSNNLAATDQSTDTCTNNFCTLNSISPTTDITLSEGNLKAVYGTSGTRTVKTSTFGLSAGKWYWEIKIGGSTSPNNAMVGITQLSTDTNTVLGTADNSWTYRGYDGKVYHNNGDEGGSLDTFTEDDIIGIAINLDNLQGSLHKLYFSKNGTFQNGADPTDFTSNTGVYGIDDNVDYFPAISDAGSSATPQFEMNFGSPSHSVSSGNSDANGHGNFEYAPPTGFFAICSKNLAEFG